MKQLKQPLTRAELKERHEFKRKKKEIQTELDDEEYKEELRRSGRGDDDQEQGELLHSK